uniref:Oocyst wall protein n=1 Tax=Chromera velia CCMP2878 TaxID=1169474 RepID=A0A0G4GIV8_9ALVE|eukprot:Cvel_4758.t1-p1 / transcript=Cvel_4758.t1 / gene=Cvel_4758 / organism=Chromera_velia_CCMP2878 / gene_product=Flocculation protein FLO11, putative / transcript_product=Flocculation protein FLO11, putative / location=Cvel_scaffold212:36545-39538(-) / protein_length=875 / sequence_SO=supercontig / SO=protein_coding / is_pseudo=false
MKFLTIPAAFAVAVAQKKGYAPAPTTYSCPHGYELAGSDCVKTVTADYETSQVASVMEVAPEKACPKGSTMSGKTCVSTTTVAKEAKTHTTEKPVLSCPKGTEGPGSDGMCTVTKADQQATVTPRKVPDQSTTVAKAPYEVSVSKPVSVAGAPVCPKGTTQDKSGNCVVTGTTTEYSQIAEQTSVSIPVNTPSSYSECPEGTTGSNGKGKGGDCTATTSFQNVETIMSEKSVRVPTLQSKLSSFSLPATEIAQGMTCPDGTTAQKDGTCTLTLTRSRLESYEVPVDAESPVIEEFPQTLTLTKSYLVPSYYCPPGTTPSGCASGLTGGSYSKKGGASSGAECGDASLICTVTLPSGTPIATSTPKTVKKARFEKKPVTVPVTRVESYPVEYCPKGTTEDANGNCVVTVTTQHPVTHTDSHTECPPGSEFHTGGSKAPKCKKPVIVTVPATQLPGDMKSKVPKYACPEGTTPVGEGPETTCATQTWEDVPAETFTTTSITFESSTITEVVPKLYRYETRTVTETATTEEVYTVYDDIVLDETFAGVDSSSYTETVPALVKYSIAHESSPVTVTNSRVNYAPCIRPDGSVATGTGYGSSHGHGHGSKGKGKGTPLPPAAGGQPCPMETKYRVVTDSFTETVPMVPTYSVVPADSFSAFSSAEETSITYVTSTMTETSHSVSTGYNTEIFPANTITSFQTSYAPTPVTTTKVVTTTVPMTTSVPAIPTFNTASETEIARTEKVTTESVCPPGAGSGSGKKGGCYLEEQALTYVPVTVTEQIPADTTYIQESHTSYFCPPGTVDTGKSCEGTQSVPAVYNCPPGSTAGKNGGCTTTSYTTTQSCPKGFTDTGQQCVMTETIPATASSGKGYSGHGHKHD